MFLTLLISIHIKKRREYTMYNKLSREIRGLAHKIKELDAKGVSNSVYQKELDHIIVKSCTCVGLGTSALLKYNLDTKVEGEGVSICPGPNMAYYSKVMSLANITDHIYGRANMISRTDRPNLFVKELHIYIEYLNNKLEDAKISMNKKEEKYLNTFTSNMKAGVQYYQNLFEDVKNSFLDIKTSVQLDLEKSEDILNQIHLEIQNIALKAEKQLVF